MFETTNQIYKWVYLGDSPIFSYGFPVVFTRCFLAKKNAKAPGVRSLEHLPEETSMASRISHV
jgi:hypothetical protein